jgi:hypothetical protein
MSTRSRRKDTGWSGREASEIPLYIALALIAVAALGLAYSALSGVHVGGGPRTASASARATTSIAEPSPTPTATPQTPAKAVGFIGEGVPSWWTASVDAGLVPDVVSGPQVGELGITITEVAARLDAAGISQGQLMAVQVGMQDIADGSSAAGINSSLETLWQGVRDRGGQPIAVLLMPSDAFPGSVVAVNAQIRASALAQGVAVLDVGTSVMNEDGTWAPGFSDDGQEPNASASAVIAQAVLSQLPGLIAQSTSEP